MKRKTVWKKKLYEPFLRKKHRFCEERSYPGKSKVFNDDQGVGDLGLNELLLTCFISSDMESPGGLDCQRGFLIQYLSFSQITMRRF